MNFNEPYPKLSKKEVLLIKKLRELTPEQCLSIFEKVFATKIKASSNDEKPVER